ncbi:MAG TPA: L,D-transpeptidase family protein [Pseudorhizobium sp.]|nr:L,D-transpeptidase family protein [Pseudorhizobium sp.]
MALAFVSAASTLGAGIVPAQAITLMDIIRGGPGKRPPVADNGLPGVVSRERRVEQDVDPQPLPKVSGPKYHTYRVDPTRGVKTADFVAATATGIERYLVDAKVSGPSDIAAALENFYGKNVTLLWVSDGEINDKARGVLELFERADDYGLDPADYRVEEPELVTASVRNVSLETETGADVALDRHARALMQFELALSAKALMFAQDTVRGRLDPNRISGYHDFKRKEVKLSFVLPFIKLDESAAGYLEGLAPRSKQFLALKAELQTLRTQETQQGDPIALSSNLLLKPGKSSPELASVVAAIRRNGSDALKESHSATFASYQKGSDYTPEIVDLVKAFQEEVGLKSDGVVGPATVRAMVGDTQEAKINKLVVAMEQARWLPAELGDRHVFINQPAYTAYYHENGVEQFSMRTVVGSKANQTYFFQDELETVEFNPYWGVPQSIIINEMLPKLRADPSYLDRMGYEVAVNGRAVPSSSVNWYGSTQSISVRQPPSSDNALGELKILFPNEHAIYMHDTPSKSFFRRDMRALSHGCVRLAEPRKMAAAVLGLTEEDIGKRISQGKNLGEKITAKIPVYVAYFTAWPNKDGVVEYFDDVYDRDTATLKALKATSAARAT